MLEIVGGALGSVRATAAEYIAARRLEAAGYTVKWIGGINRGHDLIAEKGSDRLLVDAKVLTPAGKNIQSNGCSFQIYRRGHLRWSDDSRTHLALVILPDQPTVAGTTKAVTFSISLEAARVFLVSVSEMNDDLEPKTLDWLWLEDVWLFNNKRSNTSSLGLRRERRVPRTSQLHLHKRHASTTDRRCPYIPRRRLPAS